MAGVSRANTNQFDRQRSAVERLSCVSPIIIHTVLDLTHKDVVGNAVCVSRVPVYLTSILVVPRAVSGGI